jgi:hypothetical protein
MGMEGYATACPDFCQAVKLLEVKTTNHWEGATYLLSHHTLLEVCQVPPIILAHSVPQFDTTIGR